MPDNFHKKGEHVFNDISGSVENAFITALGLAKANSLLVTGPNGTLSLRDIPLTEAGITGLHRDPILMTGRTIVAPPTGIEDDANSQSYSRAKMSLELALHSIVESLAMLAWKQLPRSNSSFLELGPISETIIAGIKDSRLRVGLAQSAFHAMVDAALDPQAHTAALTEKTGQAELDRRKMAIDAMLQHLPEIKKTGDALITTFAKELETVIERRVIRAWAGR